MPSSRNSVRDLDEGWHARLVGLLATVIGLGAEVLLIQRTVLVSCLILSGSLTPFRDEGQRKRSLHSFVTM